VTDARALRFAEEGSLDNVWLMEGVPDLDILIPVRNGGEVLEKTLGALRENRDQNYRLLVSDNYSTDGSPWQRRLEEFAPGQAVLLRPPEPLGRVEHWSWLANQGAARYCKFLLCGDILPPDHLETIAPAFAREPDLIFTPYVNVGPGTTLEREMSELALRPEMRTLSPADYMSNCKRSGNFIGPLSCVTFRASSLRAALPFDPAHPWTADWRLYTGVMAKGTAIACGGTYCLQDRRIARLSSSFQGSLNGIFETRKYYRELMGLGVPSKLASLVENFRPVVGLWLRSTLPTPLYRLVTLQRNRRG
jgi:hypothetical protein